MFKYVSRKTDDQLNLSRIAVDVAEHDHVGIRSLMYVSISAVHTKHSNCHISLHMFRLSDRQFCILYLALVKIVGMNQGTV